MSYDPYPTPPPSPYGDGYGGPPVGDPTVAPLRGATFGEAFQRFFQRYALFRGRASRSEFWWWALANLLIGIVFSILIAMASGFRALEGLWGLATIVPELALGARRLHDTNRSGWWQLLALIPIVGWIILIVWFASRERPEGARFDA